MAMQSPAMGAECITRASARRFSPEIEASAPNDLNGK
jgi:hypothetical protein